MGLIMNEQISRACIFGESLSQNHYQNHKLLLELRLPELFLNLWAKTEQNSANTRL